MQKASSKAVFISSGSYLIDSGVTACLSVEAPFDLTIMRLWVPESVGRVFNVSDIRAGVEPILLTSSPMHMDVFAHENCPNFRALRVQKTADLSIEVTNKSDKPQAFRGFFVCLEP